MVSTGADAGAVPAPDPAAELSRLRSSVLRMERTAFTLSNRATWKRVYRYVYVLFLCFGFCPMVCEGVTPNFCTMGAVINVEYSIGLRRKRRRSCSAPRR